MCHRLIFKENSDDEMDHTFSMRTATRRMLRHAVELGLIGDFAERQLRRLRQQLVRNVFFQPEQLFDAEQFHHDAR